MAIPYTKLMLVERIKKHLNDNFPSSDWNISDNEVILYIDSNIPFVLKGQMFEGAKVSGVMDIIDGYLVTYNFTITQQDTNTLEWKVTLPQPPLALPTGYDIPNVYVANGTNGRSQNAYPIKTKRQAYRGFLPKPFGFSYRVENQTMYLQMSNGGSLLNQNLFVQMPTSRTADKNAPLAMPDDAIKPLFDMTVQSILSRYQIPQDVVQDNLMPGNKSS